MLESCQCKHLEISFWQIFVLFLGEMECSLYECHKGVIMEKDAENCHIGSRRALVHRWDQIRVW